MNRAKYRIFVQNIEQHLATFPGLAYKDTMDLEHMFNMLNTWIRKGKNGPMVCNFLYTVSRIARAFCWLSDQPSYLLDRMELTSTMFPGVGLRIAFSVCRPRILNRKG